MATRQGSDASRTRRSDVAPAVGSAQGAAAGPPELKRKLVWRMGIAALMILALLGALALFDYATVPDDLQPVGQQFTEPVPVRKKEPVQPVVAAAAPAEEGATEVATEAATATAVEDMAGTVVGTASGTAAGTATRRTPVARLSGQQSPSAAAAEKPVPAPEPPPPPQVAATPALPSPGRRQFVTAGAAAEPAQAAPPAAAPQLTSGYVLHSAIFHDPGRAEEWQAKLAQEGIPSTLEVRLQIGPFKNRAEAEAARRKMNRLGIETLRGLGKTGKP